MILIIGTTQKHFDGLHLQVKFGRTYLPSCKHWGLHVGQIGVQGLEGLRFRAHLGHLNAPAACMRLVRSTVVFGVAMKMLPCNDSGKELMRHQGRLEKLLVQLMKLLKGLFAAHVTHKFMTACPCSQFKHETAYVEHLFWRRQCSQTKPCCACAPAHLYTRTFV